MPSSRTGCGADHVPDCQTDTEPSERATRHRPAEGHDTEKVSEPAPGMGRGRVHAVPSKTMAWPVRSTAMQNVGVGHDTEWRSDWPGDAWCDHVVPSKVAISPVAETTTQKDGEAQDTFWTGLVAVPSATRASWPHDVPS